MDAGIWPSVTIPCNADRFVALMSCCTRASLTPALARNAAGTSMVTVIPVSSVRISSSLFPLNAPDWTTPSPVPAIAVGMLMVTVLPSFWVKVRFCPEMLAPVRRSLTSVAESARRERTAPAVNSASRMMSAGIWPSVTWP